LFSLARAATLAQRAGEQADQHLSIHAPALVPANLAALPSIRRQPVSPYSAFQCSF